MTEPQRNSSFSLSVPFLQLAWDSTSMGLLKECPRKYQLAIIGTGTDPDAIGGYETRRESVHLIFGLHTHKCREIYDHARAEGKSHHEALVRAVRAGLDLTWNRELGRPWISDDKNKNRLTFIRTLVWYLDQFESDPFKTVILANGKPAVELSFRMESSYKNAVGETYLICGHLDRLATLNNVTYIMDIKTTKNTLSEDFFEKFTPDNQFSTYIMASQVVYALPVQGLVVDAAQVAVTFSRFQRGQVSRTNGQLEEWYRDLGWYLQTAESFARARYWPMNDKSCGNYGGCPYRGICNKAPQDREAWLRSDYRRRTWDPLQVRGDI